MGTLAHAVAAACAVQKLQRLLVLRADRTDKPLMVHPTPYTDLPTRRHLELTRQQYKVLDALCDNSRVIVRGGAGTGKTLLAVEEARRHASDGRRVFLCCYNRQLGKMLQEAITDFGDDAVNVHAGTLHSFMASVVHEAKLSHRLPDAEPSDLFDVFYPELCVEAMMDLDRLQSYDVLITDEAQDLMLSRHLDVFDALLRGGLENGVWRFFHDPFQDIFLKSASEGMKRIESCHPARYKLDVNCRNTEQIAVAAQILSGISSPETLPVAGPDVEHIWVRDASHGARETSKCIQRLLSEGIRPEEITVLSPFTRAKSPVLAGILDRRIYPVEAEMVEPEPGKVRFSTIGAFKGLESKAVVLCDVTKWDDDADLLALYVGATRAVVCLAIICDEMLGGSYKVKAMDYGRKLADLLEQSS